MTAPDAQAVTTYLRGLQNTFCAELEQFDPDTGFAADTWQRPAGGDGDSRVLADGAVFERAGVNFSAIQGDELPRAASARRPELAGRSYEVCGVSSVIHPRNPHVPTAHFNLRFFIARTPGQAPVWWFGGGFDLTPYYGYADDARHWHRTAQAACAPFGDAIYPRFKQWCDDYFYLPHRQEARGIGGLFFDDLNQSEGDAWDFARCFKFARAIGSAFLAAYRPIVERRKTTQYTDQQRDFQLYRRGRYVEFNLVYDRGTLFGLQSGGRTESILMSMPPLAGWRYNWQPQAGSPEARLYSDFLQPRNWLEQP